MKIKKLLIKSICIFVVFSLSSFLSGCIAFKSVKDKIDNLLKGLKNRHLLSEGFLPAYKSGERTIWVFYISNSNFLFTKVKMAYYL